MDGTKLGLTTENAMRIISDALNQWGDRNKVLVTIWPKRNGDLRVYLGDQSFVIGEVRVVDARKYRLLFDHEE
jgi:hypothetical protein